MKCEQTSHGAASASWGRLQPALWALKVLTLRMDSTHHPVCAQTPRNSWGLPPGPLLGQFITDFWASSPLRGRRRSRTANVTTQAFYKHCTPKPRTLTAPTSAFNAAIRRHFHEVCQQMWPSPDPESSAPGGPTKAAKARSRARSGRAAPPSRLHRPRRAASGHGAGPGLLSGWFVQLKPPLKIWCGHGPS